MRKEKIISEQEKIRKINFLINLGYTLEESNQNNKKNHLNFRWFFYIY